MELNSNSDTLSNVENQEPLDTRNSGGESHFSDLIYHPNNPPWNSWMAALTWVFSVFAIAIVPTIGVLAYLGQRGADFGNSAELMSTMTKDPTALLVNVIGVIPAHILTLFFAWFVVTRGNRHSFTKMLGWDWGGFKMWHLIGIVIGFFVFSAILSNLFIEKENEFVKMLRSSRQIVYVVAIMATLSAPIVEEVIYRGVLYSAFQRSFGNTQAVAAVTLLFAAVHVPQYYPSFVSIFVICLLSLVITLVRVKSGNLLPCIILHTIFNGVQSAVLIAEPYLKQFSEDQKTLSSLFFGQ